MQQLFKDASMVPPFASQPGRSDYLPIAVILDARGRWPAQPDGKHGSLNPVNPGSGLRPLPRLSDRRPASKIK